MTPPETPADPPRRKLTGAIVPALAAAGLAGLATLFVVGRPSDGDATARAPAGCVLDHLERFGGPINLLDVNGRRVTQGDFSSGPSVVYFGFTHCPDVCPTTLYALSRALAAPDGYDIQALMISLDPARDTPQAMRAYVATDGFPAGLQGLTGSASQVRAAAEAFHVAYRRAPSDDPNNYNVDHSSLLYVMDAQWRPRAVLSSPGQTPEAIAACISAALARPS